MNKIKKILTIITITFVFTPSLIAYADTYPNTSIAIIDLNLILSDSKAAKNATKQFEQIQKKTEDEIVESDKKMLIERDKLIEQQSVIAPEAFEIKAKDYEKKLQNYQIEKQNKLRKLEGALQKARNEILEKNSVILSDTGMDITKEVIKKLNKELPKIKVTLD
jgi:Skp family chaperone for outer membrane proteins